MSDAAQVLAWKVDGNDALESAARVLEWLVKRGVVEALPTNSGLGVLAHRPGPRAFDVVVPRTPRAMDFRELTTNGMELTYTHPPQLLWAGDEEPEFACAECGAEVPAQVVMERQKKPENPFLAPRHVIACANCNESFALSELAVSNGAFVNVILRWWNWWPLKGEFIAELRQIAGGCDVAVFHLRI